MKCTNCDKQAVWWQEIEFASYRNPFCTEHAKNEQGPVGFPVAWRRIKESEGGQAGNAAVC